jgi:hypothetical protein
MKLLVAFFVTLFAFNLLADCKTEALFIGYVKNLKTHEATVLVPEHFTFQVKPSIANGDIVNGLMVYDVKDQSYRIEE